MVHIQKKKKKKDLKNKMIIKKKLAGKNCKPCSPDPITTSTVLSGSCLLLKLPALFGC